MNPFNLPNKPNLETKQTLPAIKSDVEKLVPGVVVTDAQKAILNEYIGSVKYGIASYVSPIRCKGQECILINKCPINRAGLELPLGKDCPVERFFVNQKIEALTKDLGINLEDLGSVYDALLINDLANYELLEFRASIEMSEDPKIVKREVFGMNEDGTPMMSSSVNPIIIFKEKVAKAKMKILEELIATRKARSEDARANTRDKSTQVADMLNNVRKNKINTVDTVIEAEFTVKSKEFDV